MVSDADSTKDHAGVIARPPVLYLGCLLAGLVLDILWPAPIVPSAIQFTVGPVLIVLGLVLAAAAMARFRAAGTTVPTSEPTTAIVTNGPYRISRNPIYVALSLIYAGIGITVDSPWIVGLLVPLLVVMEYGVIRREERYLTDKFGDDYRDYKAAVRRWL